MPLEDLLDLRICQTSPVVRNVLHSTFIPQYGVNTESSFLIGAPVSQSITTLCDTIIPLKLSACKPICEVLF